MRQGVSLSCGLADWQGLRAGPQPQAVVEVEGLAASDGIDAELAVLRSRLFSPVSSRVAQSTRCCFVYLAVLVAIQLDPVGATDGRAVAPGSVATSLPSTSISA